MKEFTKRKKIAVFVLAGVIFVLAAVSLTVWLAVENRPKSKQEWLNRFKACLVLDKSAEWQGREKKIEIYEEETLVATYEQKYEVDLSGEKPIALFSSSERYYTLGTTEEDIFDEYYLGEGNLHIKRIMGNDEVKSSYEAGIETFLEVVQENIGTASYDFNKDIFFDLQLKHKGVHSVKAKVKNDKIAVFFGGKIDTVKLRNVAFQMETDKKLALLNFKLEYETDGKLDTLEEVDKTSTIISIAPKEKETIEKPKWIVSYKY